MIDRIIVLNLPFRKDRKWFMSGHLRTMGVPHWKINFYPAKYGRDFDSPKAVQDAAAADGFAFMNRYPPNPEFDERTHFSYIWNWCSMLKEIADGPDFVLVMLDDRLLKVEWERLKQCVEFLNNDHPPFHCLQLGWWLGLDEDIDVEIIPGTMFGKGARTNGDYATVFSPEGAKRLLGAIEKEPWVGPERMFFQWSRDRLNRVGLFHTLEQICVHAGWAWEENL